MRTRSTEPSGTGRGGNSGGRKGASKVEERATRTRRAGWKSRLITTISAIGAFVGAAGPAAADTLLANDTQTTVFELPLGRTEDAPHGTEYAQQFTTGPNVTGYLLESISLGFDVGSKPNNPVYVYLQEDNGRGRPGRQVAHLTKNGINFAAPVAGLNKYRVWEGEVLSAAPARRGVSAGRVVGAPGPGDRVLGVRVGRKQRQCRLFWTQRGLATAERPAGYFPVTT